MTTEIVPAIDIIDGHAVRLTEGDYGRKKVYDVSPLEMAINFAQTGVKRIHIVDLDGAKVSTPRNLSILRQISSSLNGKLEIEWGGGISTEEDLKNALNSGATQVIIGSVAVRKPEMFEKWLLQYKDKVTLGADTKDGKIAVGGWMENTELTVDDLIERFQPFGLSSVISTDISKDGMLQGPSFELYTHLLNKFPKITVTASGGVSSMDDIVELNRRKVHKAIVGKAIYEGKITLDCIKKWSQNV